VAVITNSSLIWQEEVQSALMEADWVSLKFDAVDESVWRRVDRPHGKLNLDAILEGALSFSRSFEGRLVTETMLAADVNDDDQNIRNVADFLAQLAPDVAYVSIPTRPPAENKVRPPDEHVVNRAYQILSHKVKRVEYLTGYEGDAFASTGNIKEDLVSITAVHPMRKEAVDAILEKTNGDWTSVQELVDENQIVEAQYDGHKYYMRRFKRRA
ncbi:MAG: radical SAM protein, partial [Candidatus Hydrogenedentes bacterium]|nr:radical SAM protein [Candidatus Hydrogenedentota bacterium]